MKRSAGSDSFFLILSLQELGSSRRRKGNPPETEHANLRSTDGGSPARRECARPPRCPDAEPKALCEVLVFFEHLTRFEGPVLGFIDSDFCKQILVLIFQHQNSSWDLQDVHHFSPLQFRNETKFSHTTSMSFHGKLQYSVEFRRICRVSRRYE